MVFRCVRRGFEACWLVCGLAWCACSILGCGPRAETQVPSTHTEFVDLVDTMADSVRAPSRFKDCFAKGSAPPEADRMKYEKHVLFPSPDATVEGDTARFNVAFRDDAGKEVATKEWTAVKENDQWKLKSAPLP